MNDIVDAPSPKDASERERFRAPIYFSISGTFCLAIGGWMVAGGKYIPVMDSGELQPENFGRFVGGAGFVLIGLILFGVALIISFVRLRRAKTARSA